MRPRKAILQKGMDLSFVEGELLGADEEVDGLDHFGRVRREQQLGDERHAPLQAESELDGVHQVTLGFRCVTSFPFGVPFGTFFIFLVLLFFAVDVCVGGWRVGVVKLLQILLPHITRQLLEERRQLKRGREGVVLQKRRQQA
jgi:hypothetical protein